MISSFFFKLISFWLPYQSREPVCREAINFHYWTMTLKVAAFFPASRLTEQNWRLRQVRKCVRKMPSLSTDFFEALDRIEGLYKPGTFKPSDFDFILLKRAKVASLVVFLKSIESEADISTLRAILIESKPGSSTSIKKNTKRQ